jgi:hypothetical protein
MNRMFRGSRPLAVSLVGLAVFGATYDAGLLGPTDGHDHSALVVMPSSGPTGPAGPMYAANTIAGDDFSVVPPHGPRGLTPQGPTGPVGPSGPSKPS